MADETFRGACGHEFRPEGVAKRLLERVRSGEMPLAMIECPICHCHTPVNAPSREPESGVKYRCPVETCTGWVCEVADGDSTFLGCGECGSAWADRSSLFEAISHIVKVRKYRRKVYVKSADGWKPGSPTKEPSNYEDLVEKEWDDH